MLPSTGQHSKTAKGIEQGKTLCEKALSQRLAKNFTIHARRASFCDAKCTKTYTSSAKVSSNKAWGGKSEQARGQATKSIRRMPWHREPKKDVTSCEKLRSGANIRISADVRMRELTRGNARVPYDE